MHFKRFLQSLADQLPYVRTLKRQVVAYEKKLSVYETGMLFPPGHFYSPLVNTEVIGQQEQKIFGDSRHLRAIDLNDDEQEMLLGYFKEHYRLLSFPEDPVEGKRYYYNNDAYSYADAIFLFAMMLHFRPKKIIEIGSGFSSAAMIDVNEQFFQASIDLTFIEPYPDTLKRVTKQGDRYTLIQKEVQQVDLSVFQSLQENDILFIDSTHVAKTDSDVLFELFEILPSLNKGVKIHIHDVFYPFEYPRTWVIEENRSWNEIYLLRAFLMYNTSFKVIAFNTYMECTRSEWFDEHMPLCLKNKGGSIWLEKIT